MSNREPIWNSDTTTRECGDTTFQQCGWCEHRGGGSYRYNCMLSGNCNLLRDYKNEVEFDTECKIKKLGKSDIQDIIRHKEYKIGECNKSIIRYNEQIECLNALDPKDIPALPDSREHDHFNIKDDVMIWISGDFENAIISNKWVSGKVVSGYRHHDGCVSACTDEPYLSGDYLNGCGYGAGMSIPNIILKKEYDYFANNLEDWENWIKTACDKSFNGETIDWTKIDCPKCV